VEQGRELYQRTCRGCHGVNMVNGGIASYDLRKFPAEDADRFFNSVSNGKNNMPAWKDALTQDQIKLLWSYVGSRGGKEL
jgi:mono/diheme cytochrome c family protein